MLFTFHNSRCSARNFDKIPGSVTLFSEFAITKPQAVPGASVSASFVCSTFLQRGIIDEIIQFVCGSSGIFPSNIFNILQFQRDFLGVLVWYSISWCRKSYIKMKEFPLAGTQWFHSKRSQKSKNGNGTESGKRSRDGKGGGGANPKDYELIRDS